MKRVGARGLGPFWVLGAALALSGCGAAYVANNLAARSEATESGIDAADRTALATGDLASIRTRYGDQPTASLQPSQLGLLCEVLLKYQELERATTCLDAYAKRLGGAGADSKQAAVIAGKRAALALARGDAATAASLVAGNDTPGGQFVYGLAQIKLGHADAARAFADRLRRQYQPAYVYYAASLYAAAGDWQQAKAVLEDPERRLLVDYGMSSSAKFLGQSVKTAPFHLDPFDEFSFGWFKTVDFAPAANPYVEFLAAHADLELGDLDQAHRRLDVILGFPTIEAYREIYWQALYDRAELARRAGDSAGAMGFLRRSIAAIEELRSTTGSETLRIAIAADKQGPYLMLTDLLVAGGQIKEAVAVTDRAHSRALVELLAAHERFGGPPPSHARGNALVTQMDRASDEVRVAAATAPEAMRSRLAVVAETGAALRQQDRDIATLVTVAPIQTEAVQQRLGPDEAAVAFFPGRSSWHVFIIRHDGVTVHEAPTEGLKELIAAFRSSVSDYQSTTYRATGQALYQRLLGPALADLNVKSLVIVPSGALHYIPFAALYDGQKFLIDRFTLHNVPSLEFLVREREGPSGTGGLVVGDPFKGNAELGLPAAEGEARAIASLAPGSTLLVGGQATVANFRGGLEGHRFIHFAGHAQFNADHPLESRLLLVGPDNGMASLTANQLYDLQIGATLVYLSACETGLGAVTSGDDVIGLERGFFFAGAQAVVASLWEVEDESTASLSRAFYHAWLGGTGVPAALRTAQLETRAHFAHPFFWASFVATSIGPQ